MTKMGNSPSKYAPSILQEDCSYCFLCGRRDRKLDRHEPFNASNRQKSKELGMWVMLCHEGCHQGTHGVHGNAELANELKRIAQKRAMEVYGWTTKDFIREFGKNWL